MYHDDMYTSSTARGGAGSFKTRRTCAYRIVCDNRFPLPRTFFLMTRTKLASVCFVASRNCMRQQVLDHAESLPSCGRSQSATTCDSSYVLQSTTLLKKYYSVLQSTTPYCKVLHEISLTLRGATGVILQRREILCLPRKVTLMIDPRHICNVIYNARSNRCHPPTSPNIAPATKHNRHGSWWILVTYETSFTMRGATGVTLQHHQILHLPQKMTVQNIEKLAENTWNVIYNARPIREWSDHDPSMIRPCSNHDPTMKLSVRNPRGNQGYPSRSSRAFCMEKYNISRSGYHSKFHQRLRLPRKVTVELHQILRLPRKMTFMINPLHTWNTIYNARSSRCHPPRSPNTAPATKNDSHDWSLSQM